MSDYDPSHLCCGTPHDCDLRHLYCTNRTPKHAVFEGVQSNGAGTVKAPLVSAESLIDDQMRRTNEAVARERISDEEQANCLDIVKAAQDAKDFAAIVNLTKHFRAKPAPDAARPAHAHVRLTDDPMVLSNDSKTRKETPIGTGVLDYFPRALAAVASLSKAGNDKHNPGQVLHWSKEKSTDHPDCIIRHFIDRGKIDPDSGLLHDVGLAWRALANLELTLEALALRNAS